jgi:hypothetical protein
VVPPVAARVVVYATPTVPLGRDVVVIERVGGGVAAIVRLNEADLLCAGLAESVTVKVRGVALAAAVGVPVMAPVDAFRARPAGSVPLVQL